MGFLTPGLRTWDPLLGPPLTLAEIFRQTLKSHYFLLGYYWNLLIFWPTVLMLISIFLLPGGVWLSSNMIPYEIIILYHNILYCMLVWHWLYGASFLNVGHLLYQKETRKLFSAGLGNLVLEACTALDIWIENNKHKNCLHHIISNIFHFY